MHINITSKNLHPWGERLFYLLLVVLLARPLHAAERVGDIVTAVGEVRVTREGVRDPIRMKGGNPVYFKDRIQTGAGSKVKILFKDDSIVSLGEKSQFVIDEAIFNPSEKKRSLVTTLVSGSVRSIVSKFFSEKGSTFEVHTASATAAARGTHFVVQILEVGQGVMQTAVYSIEGSVYVWSGGGDPSQAVHLGGLDFTVVGAELPPTPPEAISPQKLDLLIEETTAPYHSEKKEALDRVIPIHPDDRPSKDVSDFANARSDAKDIKDEEEYSEEDVKDKKEYWEEFVKDRQEPPTTPPIEQEPTSQENITNVTIDMKF